MLVNGPSSKVKESIGKWTELSYAVITEQSLIGKTLYVNVGAWLTTFLEGAVEQPDSGYSIVYLPIPSRREMVLFGASETWENYKVEVLYQTPTRFTIYVTFLFTSDLGGLIDDVEVPVNADRFTPGVSPSVYDSPKFHLLEIYADGDGYRWYTQMKARFYENEWSVDTYVSGVKTDGYSLTSDTIFSFEIPDKVPNFDYYAGVYRKDADENDDYITDLELIYAQISGGVQQIGLDPEGYFKANQSQDIHLVGGKYQGFVTIDKNYFEADSDYAFFIAYSEGGQWYAETHDFGEGAAQNPIYGDLTRTVYDYNSTNQSYESDCVFGLSPFERVKLCASLDKASYDVALITGGESGSFDQNFIGVEVWTGNAVYNPGKDSTYFFNNANLTTTDSVVSFSACTEFRVPSSWEGLTKFVTFVFKFNVGDHIDYLYAPFRLNMASEDSIYSNPVFTDQDGNVLEDFYCMEDVDLLVVTLDSAFATGGDIIPILVKEGRVLEQDLYANLNFDTLGALIISGTNAYTAGTTSVQYVFDADLLTPQVEYCLRLISKNGVTEDNPDPSPCACFDVDLTQTVEIVGEFISTISLSFLFDGILSSEVQSVTIEALDAGTVWGEYTGSGATGGFSFNVITGHVADIKYDFKITLENGCTYDFRTGLATFLLDGSQTMKTVDVCNPPNDLFILAQCFNWPTLEFNCSNGLTTPVTGGVFVSSITGSDLYYSLESEEGEWTAYTVPVTGASWWMWDLSFADDCPDITVHDYKECPCDCDNSPTVAAVLSGTDLIITGGGTLNSPTTSDDITYSTDGVTFQAYTGPVDVTSFDDVSFLRVISYSDCCPYGLVAGQWLRYGSDDCDYSDFDLAAWYDTVLGTHNGGKIGTDASLYQDDLEYSLDDGLTWSTYSAGITGVNTVDWRRTLDYGNCDPVILTDQTVSPCCQEVATGVYSEVFTGLSSGNTVTLSRVPTEILNVLRNGAAIQPANYSLSVSALTISPDFGYYSQEDEFIIVIYKA